MTSNPIKFSSVSDAEREALYRGYKTALLPIVEATFGWNEEFQRERFYSRYELNWFQWLEHAGKRIGYICYWSKNSEIHLSLLIVEPGYRSQGCGQLVMTQLHERARTQHSKVTLSSFRKNTGAVKFYERLGYKEIGGDEHFVDMILEQP